VAVKRRYWNHVLEWIKLSCRYCTVCCK